MANFNYQHWQLQYFRYGAADAPLLLSFHGLIGSPRQDELGAICAKAGWQLLASTRPGYAECPSAVVADYATWAGVVVALLSDLNIDSYSVLAISAGSPHAYALAAIDKRLRELWIFSGLPLVCQREILALYPAAMANLYAYARVHDAYSVAEYLQPLLFSQLPAEFKNDEIYIASQQNRGFGYGQEAKLQAGAWGFDFADISAPINMQHSRADQLVPFIAAQKSAELLNAKLQIMPTGEHSNPKNFANFIQQILH